MSGPFPPDQTPVARAAPLLVGLGVDLAALAGALMIVAGIDQMHRPSAFIAGGAILIALSVLAARRSG